MTEETNKENNTRPVELDHTPRRLIIYNVLKHMRPKELDKEINNWIAAIAPDDKKIVVTKTKKPHGKTWALLTLESESMVETFVKGVNGGTLTNSRGGVLHAKKASDAGDDRDDGRKRKADGREGKRAKKRREVEEDDGTVVGKPLSDDEVRDKTTPYWGMDYEEQLEKKWKDLVKACAMKTVKELQAIFRQRALEHKRNPRYVTKVSPYPYLSKKPAINISPIIPSPAVNTYRNKIEFTFGYHHSCPDPSSPENIVKTPCAGFLAGGWRSGVSHPHPCSHIPNTACGIADVLGAFLKDCPLSVYDCKSHTGVWRTVTVRVSHRRKECMVIICHAPPGGGAGETNGKGGKKMAKVWKAEKKRLVKMLTGKVIPCPKRTYPRVKRSGGTSNIIAASPDTSTETEDADEMVPITSIFFQEFDGLSLPSPSHPVQHAFGKEYLEEQLGECMFRISPGAFFQVNTTGAEVLYDAVVEKLREVAPENPKDTLLFDVCCGTGTIGLHCMKKGVVGRVVGVDIAEPAIRDAIVNAKENGYKTSPDNDDDDGGTDETHPTRYIASRAELVLQSELSKTASTTPIAAVVDPARDGLHADVIKSIRAHNSITRLVYVSCNPGGTLPRDAALLMAPTTKKYTGLPFKVTCAQPMDMFPSTNHVEMIMVFDRMSEEEYKKSIEGQDVKKPAQTKVNEDEKMTDN